MSPPPAASAPWTVRSERVRESASLSRLNRTTAAFAAIALAAGSLWMWAAFDARRRPFALTLLARDGAARAVRVYDLDPVRARRLAAGPVDRARWEGTIELPAGGGSYEVAVAADSRTSITFAGALGTLEHTGRPGRVTRTWALAARVPVTVEHALREDGETHLRVTLSALGAEPLRLETLSRDRSRVLRRLRPWAGVVALFSIIAGLRRLVGRLRAAPPETRARAWQWAAHGSVVLVTIYGGLLRVEALASKYPDAPLWMSDLVPVASALHPRGMKWIPPEHPHQGDPFSYLRLAREMPGFYAASVREPVFVWITKQMLAWTGGRDVAVSASSLLFSILLVPATYLLGLTAFSRGVGIAAAAAVAVERQLIGLGVDGWRDDAFAFFVVLSAAALLRLREQPRWRSAALAGSLVGLALLTRITSLSFALPALALVALAGEGPRSRRLPAVAAAAGLAALLVAPFLFACWRAYGDPLYSINSHTRFYRSRAAGTHEEATAWHSFLLEGRGPLGFIDTGLVGLTAYPFMNKWEHFDYLGAWIGPLLAVASIVGLLLWPFRPRGRLLLVILFASLLPYAFTWDIPGGGEWRFTLHAYPLYLIAAASAPGLVRVSFRTLRARWIAHRQRVVVCAAAAAASLAAVYIALCGLAQARVREDVALGRPATMAVGPRDVFFFGDGWSWPERKGHIFLRRAGSAGADVRLPLRAGRPYRLTLRLDPETPSVAAVTLNGARVTDLTLIQDDRRFGRYEVDIPPGLPRDGANALHIRAPCPFTLWLVHIDPVVPLPEPRTTD